MQSVLIADIGTAMTKTGILTVIDDELWLMASSEAPSTVGPPAADIMAGVRDAIQKLEAQSGRRLLSGEFILSPPRSDGHGVDFVIATSTSGPTLTLLVITSTQKSATSAALQRTLPGLLPTPVQLKWLSVSPKQVLKGEQLKDLQSSVPDAVVFIPHLKTTKSQVEQVNELMQFLVAVARRKGQGQLPLFVLGEDKHLDAVELTQASDVAWQSLEVQKDKFGEAVAPIVSQLDATYQDRQKRLVPGLIGFAETLAAPLQPGTRALGVAAEYLAKVHGCTLIVDVGATTTTAIVHDGAAIVWSVRAGYGSGAGAPKIVEATGHGNVIRWLSTNLTPAQIDEAVYYRSRFPASMPATQADLELEYALAIEAIRLALQAPGFEGAESRLNTIVAAGGVFRNAPDVIQTGLALLSAVRPAGRVLLLLDRFGILEPTATLAQYEPMAVQGLLGPKGLEVMGTYFGVYGRGNDGTKALEVRAATGSESERPLHIPFGALQLYPAGPGQKVSLELRASKNASVGGPPGVHASVDDVEGGTIGIIFDARRRPIEPPARVTDRAATFTSWEKALRAY